MFVINKFSRAKAQIVKILGSQNVLTDEVSLSLHSFDCSLDRAKPDAVLRITDVNLVAPVIKILSSHKIPFTQRAAATNHVGGCVTLKGGVVLNLMPLNKIINIGTLRGVAEVECCVVNADLHAALDPLGYIYQPDPASQKICTIGGNAALNAGGAKGLKYGGTREHILALDLVTPSGEILHLSAEDNGPDLLGFVIGSEGTLGVITKLWLKIVPKTSFIKTMLAAFNTVDDAIAAVAAITAAGIVPRCVEAMDKLTVQAVEAHCKSGYPTDCEALLLIETDGEEEKAEAQMLDIAKIARKHNCFKTVIAKGEAERAALWRGRSGGYAAMARLAPNVFVEDGTVPRAALPDAIKQTREIGDKYGVTSGLFFHAGDGNLHPNIVFDERNAKETALVVKAGREMLKACADMGGTISGEHGIGIEKRACMAFMYGEDEINLFKTLKTVFDPENISNPEKIFPVEPNNPAQKVLEADIKKISDKMHSVDKAVIVGLNSSKIKTKAEKIELKNLNKILDIDTKNYTLTVQSGAKVDDVVKKLAAAGLYALGLCNSFVASITGVQAILPSGAVIDYGGKYVKNSAGYNLARLFAGSKGSYGAVTKLTFRLFKEPQKTLLDKKADGINAYAYKIKNALDASCKLPSLGGKYE